MIGSKSLDELAHLIVAANSTEAFLGKEQRRRSPAQHHFGAAPAFNTAGPGRRSCKATLDQIGRTKRPHQRLGQSQARDRERFFQSFFQSPCRAGIDRFQPLHAATQLFQRFCASRFNVVLASASGLMFCFFMRLLVLVCSLFHRRACRLGSQTTNRFFYYSWDIPAGLPISTKYNVARADQQDINGVISFQTARD